MSASSNIARLLLLLLLLLVVVVLLLLLLLLFLNCRPISTAQLKHFLDESLCRYRRAVAEPGSAVGAMGAQVGVYRMLNAA